MFTIIRKVTYPDKSRPPNGYQKTIIHLSPNLKVEEHESYKKIIYKTEHTLIVSYDFLLLENVIQLSHIVDSSTEQKRDKVLTIKFYHTDPTHYEGFPSLGSVFELHIYTKKDLQDYHIQNIEKYVRTRREHIMTTIHGLDFDYYDYSYEIKK
jgi:hypothetical protein